VNSVDALVALSKAKKGTLSYLTASLPLVVYMEHLKKTQGADWVRVPFRGGGEATNAVLSGSTPIALIGIGNVVGHIKAGKMTPLVLGNNIRSPQLPDVPTLADLGYKGPPSRSWYGLFAPAGTPRAIVDRINAEVRAIAGDKEFQEKNLFSRGLVPALNTPEAFAAEIKAGSATAQQIVKDAGMEAQ
jgi:tripartite-type tricarboxylate transporter receptor subunit TctC